jgi:hypothetical protein
MLARTVALVLGLAATLVVVAGCGGATVTVTVPGTTTSSRATITTAEAATTTTAAASPNSCDALGINAEQLQEGKCHYGRYLITVVNRADTLRLRELTVKFLGVKTAHYLTSDMGTTRAKGIYEIFTVRVLNKLHSPVSFDSSQDQTALVIGKNEYSENFDAENGNDQNSFMWKSNDIQPGESQTGDLVFDVPNRAAALIAQDSRQGGGNLDFLNFSDAGNWDTASTYGAIRLYH